MTYSFNSQREERVNQGGNGNPTATIGHEPERTTANGIQGSVSRQLSPRQTFRLGGEIYFEELTSDSFNVNPVTGAVSPRRPRVPSGATFRKAASSRRPPSTPCPIGWSWSAPSDGARRATRPTPPTPGRQRRSRSGRTTLFDQRLDVPRRAVVTASEHVDAWRPASAAASARRT